tara:strand:- start:12499 stop:13074 length:576 start_codon:yes stop_codon:yes gene_type:complete
MKDINLIEAENSIFLKEISSKSELKKEENLDGYLIKSSEKEARRIIESLKGKNKIIAFLGRANTLNRRVIETLRINYLVSPEIGLKKNTLKQRDSGINHVIAKEAAKKDISIIINFSEISKLKGKEKALRLEKIIQNIKICRKVNCKIKIASLSNTTTFISDEKSRRALGVSLGMSSIQSRDSIIFLNNNL